MKHLLFAAILVVVVSCADSDYTGNVATTQDVNDEPILFGLDMQQLTRADIVGAAAANFLGNNFYVAGTKGTEAETSPSPTLVFDNYLVHYTENTANTTESNTANWEYVGVTPGTAPTADYVKISSVVSQTIKYWDYSADQYDFLAFSTGTYKPVHGTSGAADEIGVTAMKYGADLAGSATAYTFDIPSVDAVRNTYITDITEVLKANYGKEVTLRFRCLGSKVRVALYETIPGYAVKDVQFYQVDGTSDFSGTKSDNATLISAAGLPVKGTIAVHFPYIGTDNHGVAAYDEAAATVTPAASEGTEPYQTYGPLSNFAVSKEGSEPNGSYLGHSLPTATFAGSEDAHYYTTVFPVSSNNALTLRVDYTLVSIDGCGEEIHVYGAKAVVPATYTKWMPNYAYTYIFKISDNTNGWTDEAATVAGLFPITFDAVVMEATDANSTQTTITTVSTPSITTYQQGHDITQGDFSVTSGKDIYVMVMDNSTTPATPVAGLDDNNSLVYSLSRDATEAEVLDALMMRVTALDANPVTGRNGLVLTKEDAVDNTVTTIVNGVDGNPITGITSGTVSKIGISSLSADKSYAYVYVSSPSTKEVNRFEPVSVTVGSAISGSSSDTFYKLTTTQVAAGTTLTAAEAPDDAYIYFSVTDNGTGATTYSYISSQGLTTIPTGCIKVAKSVLTSVTGDTNAEASTFYFEHYLTNNGQYVTRVIQTTSASDPVPPTPASTDALTFEAKEAGAIVTFTKGTSVTKQIEYSTDGGSTWTTYSESKPIELTNVGDKVSFRGDNPAYATGHYDCSNFSCSKGCYVYGNIMSLINPTGFTTATVLTAPYTFARLFDGNHNLYNHPTKKLELPARTLTNYCYYRMFRDCNSLTTAPELPATTLTDHCYYEMFAFCTYLNTACELPALALAVSCYEGMFQHCPLTTAPTLLATTLANSCYESMFGGCTNLTTAPELPATTMVPYCYSIMFEGCDNLTTAPELPATTLAQGCYSSMFHGCASLTTAPALPALTLADGCYTAMFHGCTSLTTAPALPATTLAYSYCYGSMFEGCTSLTKAPELPATTLTSGCYFHMFLGCTNLNSVKCLATDISESDCTKLWLSGVSATGTFTKASSMTSWSTGVSGIPDGWTVVNEPGVETTSNRSDYGNKETGTWN